MAREAQRGGVRSVLLSCVSVEVQRAQGWDPSSVVQEKGKETPSTTRLAIKEDRSVLGIVLWMSHS